MPRFTAIKVLNDVEERRAFSNISLDQRLGRGRLSPRDRALTTTLVYGVLKRRSLLDHLIGQRLKQPIHKLPMVTRNLLRVGAFQLFFLDRIPVHAAVNESVQIAARLCPGRKGLVNAILRRMDRERKQITAELECPLNSAVSLALHHNLTPWFSQQLVERMGFDKAQEYVRVMQLSPPVTLRVREPENRGAVIERIKSHKMEACATSIAPGGVTVKGGAPRELVSLLNGDVVIQDEGAQLVALSCDLQEGMTVLDYCAGRGGKSFHLADLAEGSGRVTASDLDANKLGILKNGAKQLGLSNIEVKGKPDLQASPLFDRVLLDAPCSGSGVIRRHPEICDRLTEEEVERLVLLQRKLLMESADRVKVGGLLVFSVCSDLPQEGVMQMDWFLGRYPSFRRQEYRETEEIDWSGFEGRPGELSLSLLDKETDGFFIARLKRIE